MLMEVKNQIKISFLSVKYALMREMLNKTTFIINIFFMILNDASFIIQWIILFSIKENIAGYEFKKVLLLWGIAAGTYGFSHFFFKNAYYLSDIINNGKLDAFLVQPKNVLLSSITSDVETSAIGDLIYGYIMLIIYGITIQRFVLFTIFTICGGIILTATIIIFSSFSFWISRADNIVETENKLMTTFSTYPDGIFKGVIKLILYTIVPVGIVNYIPVNILVNFDIRLFLVILVATIVLMLISFTIFNYGLKKYSSSNLMNSRI